MTNPNQNMKQNMYDNILIYVLTVYAFFWHCKCNIFNAWNGECKILSSYNVNKSPLVFPVLRHIHPIYILSSYFFKMHLVLSFHLCVGFPNSLFPSGSPTKTLYIFVVSLIYAMCFRISSSLI